MHLCLVPPRWRCQFSLIAESLLRRAFDAWLCGGSVATKTFLARHGSIPRPPFEPLGKEARCIPQSTTGEERRPRCFRTKAFIRSWPIFKVIFLTAFEARMIRADFSTTSWRGRIVPILERAAKIP